MRRHGGERRGGLGFFCDVHGAVAADGGDA